MIKQDHAALVFRVWPSGLPHPNASQCGTKGGIPMFPGPTQAAMQLNQTRYFREQPMGPVQSKWPHIDYLNHRGEGQPKKQKAELMYFADVQDMRSAGFQFRGYRKLVRDNWVGWDGSGDPPQ
jgi:hypothetical protein